MVPSPVDAAAAAMRIQSVVHMFLSQLEFGNLARFCLRLQEGLPIPAYARRRLTEMSSPMEVLALVKAKMAYQYAR